MLALVVVVFVVGVVCGFFYYWLRVHGLAAEERESPSDRQGVSLLTQTVAFIGSCLVLVGGGVAVGLAWSDLTSLERVSIFAAAALFFLAAGLAVADDTESAIQHLTSMAWLVSVGCASGAAGIVASDMYGTSGEVTALVMGVMITLLAGLLWLARRREILLVAMFAGLTTTVTAAILTIAGTTVPLLAVALGLWALGVGWVIVGWRYPQPLWTTVPLAIAIAFLGPGFAVWDHPWVFAIGIATAAAAMIESISVRSTPLLAAGTLTLFGYITAAVVRSFHGSLGLPATLAICGALLVSIAVVMVRMRGVAVPAAKEGGGLAETGESVLPGEAAEAGADEREAEEHSPGERVPTGLSRPPVVPLRKAS